MKLGKRIDEHSEVFNKELESMKKNLSDLKINQNKLEWFRNGELTIWRSGVRILSRSLNKW